MLSQWVVTVACSSCAVINIQPETYWFHTAWSCSLKFIIVHQISQVWLRMVKLGKHVARHRWCRPLWNPSSSSIVVHPIGVESFLAGIRLATLRTPSTFLILQPTLSSTENYPVPHAHSMKTFIHYLHHTVYLSRRAGKFASFLCKILIYRQTRTVSAAGDVAQEACTVSGLRSCNVTIWSARRYHEYLTRTACTTPIHSSSRLMSPTPLGSN